MPRKSVYSSIKDGIHGNLPGYVARKKNPCCIRKGIMFCSDSFVCWQTSNKNVAGKNHLSIVVMQEMGANDYD